MLWIFTEFELQTCLEELAAGKYNLQLAIWEDECIYWELNPDCCDDAGDGWIFLKHVIGVNPLITDDEEIVGKLYNTYAEAAAYAIANFGNDYSMMEFGAGDHTAEVINMEHNVHIKGQEYLSTLLWTVNVTQPFNGDFFSQVIFWVIVQNLNILEWCSVTLHNFWNLVWIWQIVNDWQILAIQDSNVSNIISSDNSNNIFIESRVDLSVLWWDVRWFQANFIETEFLDFADIDVEHASSIEDCIFWNEIEFSWSQIYTDDLSFISLLTSQQSNIELYNSWIKWSGTQSFNIWSWTSVYLNWVNCESIHTITVSPWSTLITIDCHNIKVIPVPWATWINDTWLIDTVWYANLNPWFMSRTIQELFDWIDVNWPSAVVIPPIPLFKQQDFISALIEVADDKNYKLVVNAPYGGQINQITTVCSSGNAIWTVSINWTPVGSPSNTISTTEETQFPAIDHTFIAWDDLNFTISGNNFAEDVSVTIAFIRDLD